MNPADPLHVAVEFHVEDGSRLGRYVEQVVPLSTLNLEDARSSVNRLDLEIWDKTGSHPSVAVRIDGRPLWEHARVVEQPLADAEGHPSIAGDYEGLHPALFEPRKFLQEGRTEILVCSGCGETGCWPLEARIEVTTDQVRWTEFRQPHRPTWDLSALGPFTFDRQQYEDQVHGIRYEASDKDGADVDSRPPPPSDSRTLPPRKPWWRFW